MRRFLRHHRDRIRLIFVTFRRAQERKLIMSILARLAALEAAQQANSGSVTDVTTLKGEVETLSGAVANAASKDDVAAIAGRVDAIEAEIGTEPAPAAAADQPQG